MLFKIVDEKGLLDNKLFINLKPLPNQDLNENISLLNFIVIQRRIFIYLVQN